MSDLKLAWVYLRSRPLVTFFTVLSVALGLGLATIVLMLTQQTQDTLNRETANWDITIGAKGSPLQIVLNSLYYLDAPTGNIDIDVWEHLKEDPAVTRIIPMNMGDNYLGWPIVGTVPDFFADRKPLRHSSILASGRMFAKPFEAVVGADVASQHHLRLGQQLVGAHGWGKSNDLHPQSPYTIVGILAVTGTSVDRAVYTDYHSTWLVHTHHEHEEANREEHEAHAEHEHHHDATHQVTALLVRLGQPGRRLQMIPEINEHFAATAVSPVEEISKLSRTFIAPLQGVLLLVAYLVVLVSALSILISLYLTIHQRRRDIAILRSLGATRTDVFRLITLEAAVLSGLGVLIGWGLGHGIVSILSPLVSARFGVSLLAWQIQPVEFVIACSVWILGILAGLLPAILAYRLPVADTLTRE